MGLTSLKRTAAASALAVVAALGGVIGQAEAFNFGEGDLVLAIYGNKTPGEGMEALINLSDLTPTSRTDGGSGPVGNMHALTNPAHTFTFDLSAYLNAAGVIDTNPATPAFPVRYTVFGFLGGLESGGYEVKGGSAAGNLVGTFQPVGNTLTAAISWAGNVTDVNAPNLIGGQNGAVVGFGNANSHTSRMGTAERLAGGFGTVMAANLEQLLNIIVVDSELEGPALAEGQAMLFANGIFQITGGTLAAVPVPAAVVLFGTGVIGLVGIARRNLFGQTA
jgi:hypothetical protein